VAKSEDRFGRATVSANGEADFSAMISNKNADASLYESKD
jgi:hypothetical protein